MRLIDADAISKKEMNYPVWVCLKKQSTVDAVPVVRCSKCQHWNEETEWCNVHSCFITPNGDFCHPWESDNWKTFDKNDFCSYGERKEIL